MSQPVPVRVRACACPHLPHPDGDVVYLRPTLTLEAGLEAEQALADAVTAIPLPKKPTPADEDRVAAERTRYLRPRWLRTFVVHGAVGWNLLDADGRPLPFDAQALADDYALARMVADAADARYAAAILAPFQTPPAEHSQSGPTDGGTSRPTAPTPSPSA